MYLPQSFRNDDLAELSAFIQKHAFGTLVTCTDGVPFATHLPFVLRESPGTPGTLVSHLARANPQWRHFQPEQEVLAIFQGPHTYVSPTWYTGEFNVPTWNYTVVHVYGKVHVVEQQARVVQILDELVASYEGSGAADWSVPWDDARYTKLISGIVAFEVEIERMEGKFKLNQNKSVEDRRSVVRKLQEATNPEQQAIATMMQGQLETEEQNHA